MGRLKKENTTILTSILSSKRNMRSTIALLAVTVAGSTVSAQFTLLDESFDYAVALGTSLVNEAVANDTANGIGGWASNTNNLVNPVIFRTATSLDGVGAAGFFDAHSVVYRGITPIPTADKVAGLVTNFSFLINVAANTTGTKISGHRIMFESGGSSSNGGYGVNFDQETSGNITFYNRVGTTNNTAGGVVVAGGTTIKVEGTFTRTGATSGTLDLSYYDGAGFTNLLGSQTSNGSPAWTEPTGTPNPSLVVRLGNSAGEFTIDNILMTAPVPEPSAYAAILGLLALGWVGYRRRKAAA